jgi:hypothetical protein
MNHRLPTRFDIPVFTLILVLVAGANVLSFSRAGAVPVSLMQTGGAVLGYSDAEYSDPGDRCRGVLRSLGTSQLAYATFYTMGRYGTFDDLILSEFIEEDYTLINIAEGYEVGFYLNRLHDDFMILAFPEDGMGHRGYMIDARQTLMEAWFVEMEQPEEEWFEIMDAQRDSMDAAGEYFWPFEFPESPDPPKEFDVFLSEDRQVYIINHAPTFTGTAHEYIFHSVNDFILVEVWEEPESNG